MPTPDLDVCLVKKLKMDIDILMKRLSNIVEDILSLPEDDTASLKEAASVEDELGNMTLKLLNFCIIKNIRLWKRLVLGLEYDYPRLEFQCLMAKS